MNARDETKQTPEYSWKLLKTYFNILQISCPYDMKETVIFYIHKLIRYRFFACYFVCFNYSSKKINLPKHASLNDLILSLVLLFIQFCDKFILKVLANYNIQYTKCNYACDKRLPTNMFILRRSVPLKLQHMNATAYEITCTVTVC